MKKTQSKPDGNKLKNSVISMLKNLYQPLLAIVAGLLIGAVFILITGENVIEVYITMFKGGFGNTYFLLATLTRSIPIILCGLGAGFAWRAGYINIGGEGQMIVGGFMTAVAALYLPVSGPLGTIVIIMVGILSGGLYAVLAAWLDDRFGVLLLISTLMLNYIANHITHYFVAYPLKDNSVDGIAAKTAQIDKTLWLTRLNWAKGTTFHTGFFIAILVAVLVVFITRKTIFGYESKMSGLNSNFARYGGVKRRKVMYLTMLGSGALCALGGALEVVGLKHLYMQDMLKSPSYAWTGLMAALISNLNPVGTVITSIFLAGLQTGGTGLERNSNVPLEITAVIQAVITLLVSAKLLARFMNARKQKKEAKKVEGGAEG